MNRLRRSLFYSFMILGISSFLLFCVGGQRATDTAQSTSSTRTIMLGSDARESYSDSSSADRLLQLKASYADVLNLLPDHPMSEKVATQFLDAAIADGLVDSKDPLNSIFQRFPNDRLSVYLFEKETARHLAHAVDDAIAFVEKARRDFPQTALSRFSLDFSLQNLRAKDPPAFLAFCNGFLRDTPPTQEAFLVHLRKAEHYLEIGNGPAASLEYLQCLSLDPERLLKAGYRQAVIACFRQTGLIWESGDIFRSDSIKRSATGYFDELQPAFSAASVAASVASCSGAATLYWRVLLGRDDPIHVVAQATGDARRTLLLLARTASYLNAQGRKAEAGQVYGRYASKVVAVANKVGSEPDLTALHRMNTAVSEDCLRLFSNYELNLQGAEREDPLHFAWDRKVQYSFPHREHMETVKAVFKFNTQLAAHLYENAPSCSRLLSDSVDRELEVLEILMDTAGIEEVCHRVVSQFPDSDLAPHYLLVLGDCYKDNIGTPRKAIDCYSAVYTKYPSSNEAITARLREALCLYDLSQYDDAYLVVEEGLGEIPDSTDSRIPVLKFLSALCQAGLGDSEQCETALHRLVEDFPVSDIAPRALFWIASNRVSKQAYEEASDVFLELIERYPESTHAKQAKPYLDRLASLHQ